ncbi:mTERF family protein, partial [Musa troglodytarum]
MTLMNRSPYVSLLFKALTFIPRRRPADAAVFLSTHSFSAASGAPQSNLMADYLVSSCGFDPDEAAKASKLLGRIESRDRPDSVLGLFRSYGFDNTQVKKVISANPRWLLLDVEKTLAPKFRALQDLGFSCSDITHLVSSNSAVFNQQHQNVLSKIQFWQGILGSKDLLMKLCKRDRWFLGYSIEKRIQPNIQILRDFGITDQKLSKILRDRPLVIILNAETLKALISRVEGLGVARTSGMFVQTLIVLQCVSEKNFKAHLEFFKGFGWSEDDFLAAFRKAPGIVKFSLKSLQRKMEFLVNETGCTPSYLASRPDILRLSLEKRLIPRYRILTCLKSRGVHFVNLQMSAYMLYPEKTFLEKFVIRHKEFPELIELVSDAATSGPFPPAAAPPPALGFGEEKEHTKKEKQTTMTLMNRSPYVSLLFKALTFIPRRRPADAAVFLSTHSYSAASGAPQSNLMADYLVSSCGFDPDEAAKASKLLGRIESRHQPDSVLGLFRSYGFDNTQVKKVISANPRWLLLDVEKTLAPKFRSLQDLGFSCSDITQLVSSNSTAINQQRQNVLSKIQFWQGILGSKDLLLKLCKRNRWFLGYSIEKKIQPNIEILRDCGITDQKLSKILRDRPLVITLNAETLKALISRVEGLGVARTSGMFLYTLSVLHCVSEKNFKAHLEFFKGFGWSEDDFLAAFRKTPVIVAFSLKSLQRKMEFLVNEAGCAPSYLAQRPGILRMSLEKRLIPRYRILTCLKSRGVHFVNLQMSAYMSYPEKKFLEKFVIRYKEFPELIELYN